MHEVVVAAHHARFRLQIKIPAAVGRAPIRVAKAIEAAPTASPTTVGRDRATVQPQPRSCRPPSLSAALTERQPAGLCSPSALHTGPAEHGRGRRDR